MSARSIAEIDFFVELVDSIWQMVECEAIICLCYQLFAICQSLFVCVRGLCYNFAGFSPGRWLWNQTRPSCNAKSSAS